MTIVVSVVVLLVGLNALYVAAEFGAVSVRRARVHRLADEGNRLAGRLVPILDDARRLDDYIAACQVGITLSSLVLGAYGQANLSDLLVPLFQGLGGMQELAAESASAVAILLGLTATQMVLGELVPKSVALQFPTNVSRLTVVPIEISLRLFAPFIRILNGSGWALLRLLGMKPDGHRHLHSTEEIRHMFIESRRGGLLDADEAQRLEHALALGQRKVRHLMVPRTAVVALPLDATVGEALELTRAHPFTRFPVRRESLDDVAGYVHVRELAAAAARGEGDRPLESVVHPLVVVPEETSADQLLARLREIRSKMALVVDEFGGVAGVVTLHDVLTDLLGEVVRETWQGPPAIVALGPGRWRLAGSLAAHQAERVTRLPWTRAGAGTVSGVIVERLGRIARRGDRVELEGALIEVEGVDGTVAESVLVDVGEKETEGGAERTSGDGADG
jgi:CBS domain containing-hemolysin-like protein